MPPRGIPRNWKKRWHRPTPPQVRLGDAEGLSLTRAKLHPSGERMRVPPEPTLEELAWVPCTATRPADCACCCEPIGRGEKAFHIWPRKGAPRQLRERLLCRWCGEKIAEKREATAEDGEGARG